MSDFLGAMLCIGISAAQNLPLVQLQLQFDYHFCMHVPGIWAGMKHCGNYAGKYAIEAQADILTVALEVALCDDVYAPMSM